MSTGFGAPARDSPPHRLGIEASCATSDAVTGTAQDMWIPGLLASRRLSVAVKSGAVAARAPGLPTGTPGTS
ncbi:hypothetical protein [Streptomyces sp. NPDC058084]|uniref:hypothetical protein n=1 Tax=Streptomyces sp. NPDC058084 TaxID=3346333 RepID=UPI0036E0B366